MIVRIDVGGAVTNLTAGGIAISPITNGILVRLLNSNGSIGQIASINHTTLVAALIGDF
jgi:hypothetical protein